LVASEDWWVVGGASVYLLLGSFLFGLGARNVWRALACPAWPKSPGIVVTSETDASVTTDRRTRTSTKRYFANIGFQNQANGLGFTTDTRTSVKQWNPATLPMRSCGMSAIP
jgi:hypothetical protein